MRKLSVLQSSQSRPTRRQHGPDFVSAADVPPRFLERDCFAALADRTDGREARLLKVSNERFERVCKADPNGEFARLASFEAGYLALATVLAPDEVEDESHPSLALGARTTTRLALLAEDASLAVQLSYVYRLNGWETLDLEAIFEWCGRVRLAVLRYLAAS